MLADVRKPYLFAFYSPSEKPESLSCKYNLDVDVSSITKLVTDNVLAKGEGIRISASKYGCK